MATLQQNVAARKKKRLEVPTVATPARTATVINPRSAEVQNKQQMATHAAALIQQGVGVPTQGYQGAGVGTPYSTLEDAQLAAQDEYTKTGAVTPATEAAIARFKDPSIGIQDAGRTNIDVYGGLVKQAGDATAQLERSPAGAPLKSPEAGAMGKPGALGISGKGKTITESVQEARGAALENIKKVDESRGTATPSYEVQAALDKAEAKARQAWYDEDAQRQSDEQRKIFEQQQKESQEGTSIPQTLDYSIPDTGQQNTANLNSLLQEVQTNPIYSNVAPLVQELLGRQSASSAEAIFTSQMLNFMAEDLDRGGVSDDVEEGVAAREKVLEKRAEKRDAIEKENRDIALEAAKIRKDMAVLEKSQFELGQAKAEQDQIELNVENEIKNRRLANRLGIEQGTNGLQFLQKEVRKGAEHLENMRQFGDLQSAKYAMQIGGQYNLDVKTALNNYESNQNIIDNNFEDSLIELQKTVSLDAKERRDLKAKMYVDYWDRKSKEDERAAVNVRAATNIMISAIKDSKNEKLQKEQDALDRIEYLSSNFAPDEVADMIKELAKDITSFDASGLAGLVPLDAKAKIAKARSVGVGGGVGGGFLPTPEQKPAISFDEFTAQKIAEEEELQGQTFSIATRDELKIQNAEIWKKQHNALVAPSIDNLPSSGNVAVDNAAKDVLDGQFGGTNPIKNAAKTWQVSEREVAQQVDRYRTNGYVPDFPQFTDEQVKRYEPFVKRIRNTDEYRSAANANFILRRIGVVLSLKTGQGDSTAIELLQRGIKDPGMAVRNDDIERIVAAVPWIDKWNPEQILAKITAGRLFGKLGRAQFLETVNRISQETIDSYNEDILPRVRVEAKRLGLPESAFRNVNDLAEFNPGKNVQDTVSEYGYGSFFSE